MAANGSSAISRSAAMTIFLFQHSGTSRIRCGEPNKAAPGSDWWTAVYPADNMQRPTGPLCDGCHSVNYNIETKTVTEWNVGCEKCHGPGAAHVRRPSRANIVNPVRLDSVHANDVCIQRQLQGQPRSNRSGTRYYRMWPVGFDVRKNLDDYWVILRRDHERVGGTEIRRGVADATPRASRGQLAQHGEMADSLPDTVTPRASMILAMPDMPAPPMAAKCSRRARPVPGRPA